MFVDTNWVHAMFMNQLPAKQSASKMMEQQKKHDALAMQKRNLSYQLLESESDGEAPVKRSSGKSKKSKKRQLRNKKESSDSEE